MVTQNLSSTQFAPPEETKLDGFIARRSRRELVSQQNCLKYSEYVQCQNFPSAAVLSRREFNSHIADAARQSGRVNVNWTIITLNISVSEFSVVDSPELSRIQFTPLTPTGWIGHT